MSKPHVEILRVFILVILILSIVVLFTILTRYRLNNLHKDKHWVEEKQETGLVISKKLQVKEIQQILKNSGFDPGTIDGIMGNRTRQAIRKFQEAKGLQPTSKIDKETQIALNKEKEKTEIKVTEPQIIESDKKKSEIQSKTMGLQLNSRTEQIQMALKQAGFYEGQIDGKMDTQTKQAIKSFQKSKGLIVDGIVGPKTWEELNKQFK